jgi:hypothetical protein
VRGKIEERERREREVSATWGGRGFPFLSSPLSSPLPCS